MARKDIRRLEEVVDICSKRTKLGLAVFPNKPEGKYSYIYTRDQSLLAKTLQELGDSSLADECCQFIANTQGEDGGWVQRYTVDGRRAHEVEQEDNTALASIALISSTHADEYRDAVSRAANKLISNIHPTLFLASTTTSIHETPVNSGFEIWNTCAHWKALSVAGEYLGSERTKTIADRVKSGLMKHLFYEGRFLRRLKPNGEPDFRADITMLSPHYFEMFDDLEDDILSKSVKLIEKHLAYPSGGYTRYQIFEIDDEMTDFPGAWPMYSCWLAEYYLSIGEKDKYEEIVKWIEDVSEDGFLPEMVIDRDVFMWFEQRVRGKLEGALKDDVHRKKSLREVDNLKSQYEKGKKQLKTVLPLVWAHSEYEKIRGRS